MKLIKALDYCENNLFVVINEHNLLCRGGTNIGNIYSELRMLVIDKYLIIYLTDEESKNVSIKRILYASSNWKR